ncbi:uncharacterized protein LOC116027376 isoform X1 [Ipomoea triloba]|uniref:uncharacterized protein LOC116027376 isoform X1 n=1 Tax=Ipomoea triloba TaxID=35885 RepID=UPI00125DB347|nr:uncharacterized protein LOC116027376 isoform X1 [Ipomoea triloba]
MELVSLLLQATRFAFHVLSWPSVTVVCPLYTSIRAIESDKESCYQHCLKCWVLFAIITLLEWTFAEFVLWIYYWPHVKGLAYLLLALPYSGSASFIYSRYVKPYITPDSCVHSIFLIPEMINFTFGKQNECTDAALAHIEEYEEEKWESLFNHKIESYHTLEQKSSLKEIQYEEVRENFVTFKGESDLTLNQHSKPQKVQKQWNCAVCEVSATSKNYVGKHMKGTKQNQEEELIATNKLARSAQEYREEVSARSVICETYYQPANLKNVQKEWSCPLCLVSTSGEKNLREHMQGKKHKLKEKEFKEIEAVCLKEVQSASKINAADYRVTGLLESLKLIQLTGLFNRPIKLCSWKKPDRGWIKLNTDGSVDKGHAGFGGLLRDHNGAPICAYVCKAPRVDSFMVELWGIWRGVQLASNMGIKFIWVESDSMSAVKSINREQPLYAPMASACLECIWETLTKFDKYRVSHSYRESNKAADCLSKIEVKGRDDVVLLPVDFPRCLKKMIQDDAQGKWYYRS